MANVSVKLGDRSYTVVISSNKWEDRLPQLLKKHTGENGQVFVFYDAQLYALYGKRMQKAIKRRIPSATELVLPPGDRTKSTSQLNRVHSFLLANNVSRSDLLLACGGGATSDLVGFAAATILRGVRWCIVSTTLLGMVDAAVGGKTGINHRLGKNLIGAFWQPSFVICDTDFFHTLPKRQIIAGLGEVVKYAGLTDKAMLETLEKYLANGDLLHPTYLAKLIQMSIQYKADIVSRDERDGGIRTILNLGHTFGHAIEKSLGYGRLLHGEAVLIGLLAAIELSVRLEPSRARCLESFRRIVLHVIKYLPKRRIDLEKTLKAMALDKKRYGKQLRFVLIEKPGQPIIIDNAKPAQVRQALKAAMLQYEAGGDKDAPHFDR